MPKIRKHSSKRVTLKQKYNIQKHVSRHNKKIKKEARKLRALGVKPKCKNNYNLFIYRNEEGSWYSKHLSI